MIFGSITRRGFWADIECPVELKGRQSTDRVGGGGKAGEETVEDRKTTDLPAVRE